SWAAAARFASARIWPAQEYTRVVFETREPIPHDVGTLSDPDRVVLDFDGVELTSELAQLPMRVQPADPYIAAIRFGTRAPSTLRVVFDLKVEPRPQVFALSPVAEFGHRIVLDLYPLTPVDPLMALLEEKQGSVAPAPPAGKRTPDRARNRKADSDAIER